MAYDKMQNNFSWISKYNLESEWDGNKYSAPLLKSKLF